jgi:hypothetical protein
VNFLYILYHAFTFYGGSIYWQSHKQSIVVMFSNKVEYIVDATMTKELLGGYMINYIIKSRLIMPSLAYL